MDDVGSRQGEFGTLGNLSVGTCAKLHFSAPQTTHCDTTSLTRFIPSVCRFRMKI